MRNIKGKVKLTFNSKINYLGKQENEYQFEIIREYADKDHETNYLDIGIDQVGLTLFKGMDGYELDAMSWEGGNIYHEESEYLLEYAKRLAEGEEKYSK
jgi:hypothetical protein